MTRQTAGPIRHTSMSPTNRLAEDIYHQVRRGSIVLDPPYQRGSVWTTDQRLDLMFSFMNGYPIGTVIMNDRMRTAWSKDFKVAYAVIDGKQRIETVMAWFGGELAIPASWVPAANIRPGHRLSDTGDGPYLTVNDLTGDGARRIESRMSIPVVTAQVDTLAAEAEIYRLVNTGGTAHTAEELARAAAVEKKG